MALCIFFEDRMLYLFFLLAMQKTGDQLINLLFSGLQDYEAALKIEPHNEALQRDAQIIRDIIQGSAGQNGTQ